MCLHICAHICDICLHVFLLYIIFFFCSLNKIVKEIKGLLYVAKVQQFP